MAYQRQQILSKTIPLKLLVDKQSNKVVFVEATKDFVDTLFSFLSLPLGTIVRLLATTDNNDQQQLSESSPFLDNIKNLYQIVQNLNTDDVWNNHVCKQMLLRPRNPCESLCMKLFLNIDDTEPSDTFFVCDSCNKFTNFRNLDCTCGKPPNRQPENLDSKGLENTAQNGIFVRESGPMFLVSDDLKVLPSSMLSSLEMLVPLGYSDLTQLEEVTHNIGKHEILNLLKYTLTSHEPLTNTFLGSSSKKKDNLPNQFASVSNTLPCASNIKKMNVKVMQSKSQKNVIYAEANGDFVDFIFSLLTIPLGSIVKLLGANSFAGCIGKLYKSVENLDPTSVLLNPGITPQFSSPNQPLNVPHVKSALTTYYYGRYKRGGLSNGKGVISMSNELVSNPRPLKALDPRQGAVGFVKNAALYGVGNDLKVKSVSAKFCLSYLKEQNLPLDDLEVKVISIGEVEALSLLGASLTSDFTLTRGLGVFLNMPKQEST